MWLVLLGVLLLIMKLMAFGPVADLSWWWVLSPFLGAAIWWTWADSTGYYQRKTMEKLDAKRVERRTKNLDALGMDHKGRRR